MASQFSDKSYRDFLHEEFNLRKARNIRYSLRSFATLLNLSPAFLSLLMRGKKNLSQSTAIEIADRLKWSAEQKKYFVNLVEFENPHTDENKKVDLERILKIPRERDFKILETDIFPPETAWQHHAILVLLTLNQDFTVTAIKERLNISLADAKATLQRLQELKLVICKNQIWKATNANIKMGNIPSLSIRKFHKQMLAKADLAIEQQNFSERDFSNTTFTVDKNKLEPAKNKITEFRKEMAKFLEGETPSEVYQLSIQLFKLTQSTESHHELK